MTFHPEKGQHQYLEVSSEHDIPTWVPWAVMGVGAAVGAAGGVLYGKAWVDRGRLDARINQTCVPNDCEELDARFLEPWNVLKNESNLGIGGMAVGATVVLGGVALFLWNRTPVLQITPRTPVPNVAVQVNEDGAMISGQLEF